MPSLLMPGMLVAVAVALAAVAGYALEMGGYARARLVFWTILVLGIVVAFYLPQWVG